MTGLRSHQIFGSIKIKFQKKEEIDAKEARYPQLFGLFSTVASAGCITAKTHSIGRVTQTVISIITKKRRHLIRGTFLYLLA